MKRLINIKLILIINLFLLHTVLTAQISEDLIMYFPFNGNTNDVSGNNYLIVTDNADFTYDQCQNIESALEFNGFNFYDTTHLYINSSIQSHSISIWIKLDGDQSNGTTIFELKDQIGGNTSYYLSIYRIFLYENRIGIVFGDITDSFIGEKNLHDNNWHHLVVNIDGENNTFSIYIDLNSELTNSVEIANISPNHYCTIDLGVNGVWPNFTNHFSGIMDEYRLYSKILTTNEIKKLYYFSYCSESMRFVTGGGWINSPEGAYISNPSLVGKANFGFVSKYIHGQSNPDGNTQFNFRVANLEFSSTSYEWLLIDGNKAIYKGTGKINQELECEFILIAIDGDKENDPVIDKFRIRIWDQETGFIVYDNQLDYPDDEGTSYQINGGNITVHNEHVLLKDEIVEEEMFIEKELPINYELKQNYPNPFNPTTTISYSIPIDGYVSLSIYDVLGNEIAVLTRGYKTAGIYSSSFDASNLTSGIYFYKLQAGNFIESKKMILLR